MPKTTENDIIPEPAGAIGTRNGKAISRREGGVATDPGFHLPDLMPLVDAAERRVNTMMDSYEESVRSVMLVSAAGVECGTIWTRGCREIGDVAANGLRRTTQTALEASGGLAKSWMDLNVQVMDVTAARLTETA
jgi:hypothetical protein